MENLPLAVIVAANALLTLVMICRLWPYLGSRTLQVFLNGQYMREGEGKDYVWDGAMPKFNFMIKARKGRNPDVLVIREIPRTYIREYKAVDLVVEKSPGGIATTKTLWTPVHGGPQARLEAKALVSHRPRTDEDDQK